MHVESRSRRSRKEIVKVWKSFNTKMQNFFNIFLTSLLSLTLKFLNKFKIFPKNNWKVFIKTQKNFHVIKFSKSKVDIVFTFSPLILFMLPTHLLKSSGEKRFDSIQSSSNTLQLFHFDVTLCAMQLPSLSQSEWIFLRLASFQADCYDFWLLHCNQDDEHSIRFCDERANSSNIHVCSFIEPRGRKNKLSSKILRSRGWLLIFGIFLRWSFEFIILRMLICMANEFHGKQVRLLNLAFNDFDRKVFCWNF